MNKSHHKNYQSAGKLFSIYNIIVVENYIILYKAIYLKQLNEETNELLPYLITSVTQEIFSIFEVKGAAIDASAWDNDIPTSAALRAEQSFAPSPQKHVYISFNYSLIICYNYAF